MNKDFFAHKATGYDHDSKRVTNVNNIAKTIVRTVELKSNMHLMDFGSGTGLLLERIAEHVGKITAIDISESMNEELINKRHNLPCELDILPIDLETSDINQSFDGIISSMTLHHIKDIDALFRKFHSCLSDGGFIAISDLDLEDGSFHKDDTGVHHFGFDRDEIARVAEKANFRDVIVTDASIVSKPYGEYAVFLLTAKKKGYKQPSCNDLIRLEFALL